MNKWKIMAALVISAGVLVFFFGPKRAEKQGQVVVTQVSPALGDIEKVVLATGVVQPQNRLEMKPPVAGRIDKILVTEGQDVRAGEVVALMSSAERAALLDAAKSKGEKEIKYWEEIYRPIPLIAPIDGKVIVSTTQSGQTVVPADVIVVLSNHLIVQAQVDETDIGRVREGQETLISLDAYPDIQAKASVSHIYHESKIVNNVTIYQVDILPQEVPPVFRSGMSANVRIVEEKKENVLLIPLEAVVKEKSGTFVLVSTGKNQKPVKSPVLLGILSDTHAEVVEGVEEKDVLVIETKKYVPSKNISSGSSPFAPGGQRRSGGGSGSSR